MPAPHLAEFVSAYVLEAEEHLGAANGHLLATEAARRLYPSHFATPERDIARVGKRLERVGQALRLLR